MILPNLPRDFRNSSGAQQGLNSPSAFTHASFPKNGHAPPGAKSLTASSYNISIFSRTSFSPLGRGFLLTILYIFSTVLFHFLIDSLLLLMD